MNINKKNNFKYFSVFLEQRMLKICLLGVISGFPWVIIGSSLSLWLKEEGLSRSAIGWAGLIFGVYAINFLWSPLMDKLRIPLLSKKIGQRKSWILSMQLLIGICLLLWFFLDPNQNLFLIIFIGLLIAIFSSSQDISIDALRIEQINENEKNIMAAGATMTVIGWWTGFKIGGLFTLTLSDYFDYLGFQNYWQITFIFLILIITLMNLLLLKIKENPLRDDASLKHSRSSNNSNSFIKILVKSIFWITSTISDPLINFFKKNGLFIAVMILLFIFLYKIGEAFLGRMSLIFYNEVGFSKSDIGIFSKGLGWLTTIFFTLLGGFFSIRFGIIKSVFIAGIFMAVTNLLFAVLFWTGKNYMIFATAVILDDVAAAFATVAFVAFISVLVNRKYTATQYALLASLGTLGRTTLASSSGSLVDYLNGDWGLFFVLTTLMVTPSLIILLFLRDKLFKENKN